MVLEVKKNKLNIFFKWFTFGKEPIKIGIGDFPVPISRSE